MLKITFKIDFMTQIVQFWDFLNLCMYVFINMVIHIHVFTYTYSSLPQGKLHWANSANRVPPQPPLLNRARGRENIPRLSKATVSSNIYSKLIVICPRNESSIIITVSTLWYYVVTHVTRKQGLGVGGCWSTLGHMARFGNGNGNSDDTVLRCRNMEIRRFIIG